MKATLTLSTFIGLFVFQGFPVTAEDLVIPVLGEPWHIIVDVPSVHIFQARLNDPGFAYQAASKDGFNISCFVEMPEKKAAGKPVDCYEYYWTRMKRNSKIEEKSIQVDKQDNFVRVTYDYTKYTAELAMQHINYYIVYEGRWIDIHLSMPKKADRNAIAKKFEQSLRFVSTPKSK